jgi:hypothetical protein
MSWSGRYSDGEPPDNRSELRPAARPVGSSAVQLQSTSCRTIPDPEAGIVTVAAKNEGRDLDPIRAETLSVVQFLFAKDIASAGDSADRKWNRRMHRREKR